MIEEIIKDFKELNQYGFGMKLDTKKHSQAYKISLKELNKQLEPYGLIAGLDPHSEDKTYIIDTFEGMKKLQKMADIKCE